MKCEKIQTELLAQPDPAQPSAAVQAHLASCPDCQALQAHLIRLEQLVVALPVPPSTRAKREFLATLTPPTRTKSGYQKPVATTKRAARRSFSWTYSASIAAALLVAVGGLWMIFGQRSGSSREPIAQPRHELLNREVKHISRLAQASTPTARLSVWADWATDIRQESKALHGVASPDEMAALATMFEKAVNRGVLAQAKQLPRILPAEERHATLTKAIGQLAEAEVEASTLAKTAPTPTQKYFTRMAETAKDARQDLLKRLNGEGA